MHVLIQIGALGAYLAASAVLVRPLLGGERSASRNGPLLGTFGVLLHLAGAAAFAVRFGELPLAGLGPSLSTLALLMGLWAVPPLWMKEVRPLGVILMPLAALLLATALLLGLEPTPETLAYRGLWFRLHVTVSMLGYACFAGAFAAGLLYLLQHRELKGKHFGRMFRFFPSLETLERWQRRALELALSALTVGLLSGWAWLERFEMPLSVSDAKLGWGVLSWLVLLSALLAHLGRASRRRGAFISVLGFVVVVASFVLLRLSESGGMFL